MKIRALEWGKTPGAGADWIKIAGTEGNYVVYHCPTGTSHDSATESGKLATKAQAIELAEKWAAKYGLEVIYTYGDANA